MAVTTPERDWTDSRLDDLKEAIDGGHKEMKASYGELDKKIDAGFAKVEKRFEKVDERFERTDEKMEAGFSELRGEMKAGYDKLDSRFYRLMSVLVVGLVSIIGTMIGIRIF